ncbi:ABC transporter ATP-binding protein [Gimesia fumaroli]|uniref:ABC transporter ATP-binding protein n=1 Tax=Gimesia fumaroli TaxID=2527976 RepID=UPI001E296954|nr:ABC transporter ATP-binding protein [Gimesia fumaroli]
MEDVSLVLKPGVMAIIGPNGSGKSTLMKCLAGLLHGTGHVALDGQDVSKLPTSQLTRLVSYMPQEFSSKAAISVFEAVLLGRLQQLGLRIRDEDVLAVESLLDELDLRCLANRWIAELSGGQAQLVAIAQALAREPVVLLMDEPTSNLDLRRQFEVCELVRRITDSRKMSTAIALHDLNLAARCADTICVLSEGRLHSVGPPLKVITREMVESVYRVDARIDLEEGRIPIVTIRGVAR